MKKSEEAIVWFEKFLKEEPNNKAAHDYMTKLHNIVPVKLLKNGNENKRIGVIQKQNTPKIIPINEEITKKTLHNMKENDKKNKKQTEQRNEWGFIKKQPIPRGQPEFMRHYENEKRIRNRQKSELHKTSSSGIAGNTGLANNDKFNTNRKPTDKHQQYQQGTTLRAITERKNQFLDAPEDYKPKAIVDIFGTNRDKKADDGISSHIELMPRRTKEKASERPKIEVLKSVDFDN